MSRHYVLTVLVSAILTATAVAFPQEPEKAIRLHACETSQRRTEHLSDAGLQGPEAGDTTLTLTVRSGDDVRRTITPTMTRAEINGRYEYRWIEEEPCGAVTVETEWQTAELPIQIGSTVDRVKIEFAVNPPGAV